MHFDDRNGSHAIVLEQTERALQARGFTVARTGQEWATPPEHPGRLRAWWPDLLATRGPYGRLYVDAKSDVGNTANYSIELAALACYGIVVARFRVEVVVVFPGGACNYAMDLCPLGVMTRASDKGSGTAYVLVRKDDQKPFEAIFGTVAEGQTYKPERKRGQA